MSKYNKNMLSGAIFLVIGIALLIVIPMTINEASLTVVGPRAFPTFIAYSLIGLSIALMISTYLEARKNGKIKEAVKVDEPKELFRNEVRVLLLVAIMLLYVFTFDKLGYFISTFIVSTLTLLLFRVKKWYYYLIVYAVAGGIYVGFTKLLFVMLP